MIPEVLNESFYFKQTFLRLSFGLLKSNEHKSNSVKSKSASSLVLLLQRSPYEISFWIGWQAVGPSYLYVVVTHSDWRQAYRLRNRAPSLAWYGAVARTFDLELLLLNFQDLPCLLYWALTKKPNIDAIVQVQKFIQLIHNCTFS